MLKIIYEERGLTLRDMTYGQARDMIEMQKLFRKPEYYLDMLQMSPEALLAKYHQAQSTEDIIFYGYLYQEKKCFGLDYNDLIKVSLYIFHENPEIRLKWQKRLEYIMIDEFQDIDGLQYELMEVLCGYHHNLFIVGDPDQTIYTWRGANVRYLLDFPKNFPGARTIMMVQNYRSTPEILSASNSLIEKNRDRIRKDLLPELPAGSPVLCHFADTAEKEAEWIALSAAKLHEDGVAYRDMTILYRAHYITRSVEEVFLKAQIPYTIYSGVQFFQRMEIKDALAYLRMIAYRDDLSFRRIANVPKRNIGNRRMKYLEEYTAVHGGSLFDALCACLEEDIFRGTKAKEFVKLIREFSASSPGRAVSEVLSDILDKSGYEKMLRTEGSQERLDDLAELRQAVFEYETTCGEEVTLEHYLDHIALFTNQDTGDKGDRVRMMTIHTAKGLEFPYVFLCGLNEGIFPSKKTRTRQAMEEERRLCFVAMTRAQKGLFLSEAAGRNFDGSPRYPSRFIMDIDPRFIRYTEPPQEGLLAQMKNYAEMADKMLLEAEEKPAFSAGDRVRHAVFGEGTVLSVDEERRAFVIRFDNMETPRTIAARVKLERL